MVLVKREQNHTATDTYISNDYINAIKFMEMKSKHRTGRKRRKTKDQFSKRIGKNADLPKPILNKIMTTHE